MDRDYSSWLDEPRPSWPPEHEHHEARRGGISERQLIAAGAVLGVGALAGLAAYAYLGPSRPQAARHGKEPRLVDDAPGRTAKQARFGDYAVTGRSVTIDRPREEIYAFWRDFSNLPKFMENIVNAGELEPGLSYWRIRAPLGMSVEVRSRVVNDRPGEQIAWRSTEDSQIETEGKVMFRDAPGGRGTIVEAVIAYKPPMGALGQAVAKLFSAEPSVQSRRDLKRLKMLLETGEIATSANRRSEGGKFQQAPEAVQADLRSAPV
jgi:uncharacterized membrane protein